MKCFQKSYLWCSKSKCLFVCHNSKQKYQYDKQMFVTLTVSTFKQWWWLYVKKWKRRTCFFTRDYLPLIVWRLLFYGNIAIWIIRAFLLHILQICKVVFISNFPIDYSGDWRVQIHDYYGCESLPSQLVSGRFGIEYVDIHNMLPSKYRMSRNHHNLFA